MRHSFNPSTDFCLRCIYPVLYLYENRTVRSSRKDDVSRFGLVDAAVRLFLTVAISGLIARGLCRIRKFSPRRCRDNA